MRSLAAIPVLLLALAACGDDSDGDSDALFGDTPKCSDVWKEGATIPKGYEGCSEGGELFGVAVYDDCENGEVLMRDDHGFGFEGEEAHVVPDGVEIGYDLPEYDQIWRECYPLDEDDSAS